jgi:hypothetical protein
MPRVSKLVVGSLLAFGPLMVVIGRWPDIADSWKSFTVVGTVAWEALLGVGWLFVKIAAVPANRRLGEIGDAMDRALGRRMSQYGRRYRQWVLDSRRFMEAKGLATVGDFTPELDEVFVDVSLAPNAPHRVTAGMFADVPVDITERYSIWEFLASRGRPAVLAVIGAPGSGKTTLLSYVARRVAMTPKERHRPIPVMLLLRDHARQVAADAKVTLPQLIRSTMPDLSVHEPADWWENRLQRGRCVVLLDGLDEVASAHDRQAIAGWVNQQIAVYPGNDYVITSRPHGYRAAVIDSAQVLQVRVFTGEQVRTFLHGWYLAVERRATGTSGREVEIIATEAANDLLDRLAATPALYDLTVNPLLLTMIANVHRYRGSLPGSRADLYGEVCQVMLWRRQEAKKLAVELPGASKERLLAHLAFVMMREGFRNLSRRRVLDIIRPGLTRMSTAITAEDFLTDVGSNGLLVERERDLYAFAHLTFQEYLAAKYIQEHNLVRILVDNVDDGWWRETTLLYVAGADADPIVRACLAAGTPTALSLAFECTETGAEVAPDLRDHLKGILAEAFDQGASSEHRHLVAGVLAARHLGRLISTSSGSLVCPHPITTNLYWLFLQDSDTPQPEGRCAPDPAATKPVTGVWGTDALSFLAWLNAIRTGSGEAVYRLPTTAELDDLATKAGPAAQILNSTASSVWTKAASNRVHRLWTLGGKPRPRTLSGADLLAATTDDVTRFRLIRKLQPIAVSAVARALARLSEQSLTRATALANMFVQARSALNDPENLGPAHNLTRLLTRDLARDRQLAVALDRALTLLPPTATDQGLARQVVDDLARYRHRKIAGALVHASSLDRDLSIASASSRDFGLGIANDHARAIDRALVHAGTRLAAILDAPARTPAGPTPDEIDHAFALDHDPSQDIVGGTYLDGGPDEVLATAMGSALGDAFLAVLDQLSRDDGTAPESTFGGSLLRSARLAQVDHVDVDLDGLEGRLRQATKAVTGSADVSARSETIATRLVKDAQSILGRRRALGTRQLSLARMAALVLAKETDEHIGRPTGDHYRTIACGLALFPMRASRPGSLETIILARA